MSPTILVTGGAGYIGGSLIADLLRNQPNLITKENVIAPVRSQEQADALSKFGVKAVRIDLSDEKAVTETVLQNNVTVVIQTATSVDLGVILPLVKALGKQKQVSGQNTFMIHTSGTGAFCPMCGWPEGEFKDTDAVFEKEKELRVSFLPRGADVTFIETAQAQGASSYIVVPPVVYGKGTGPYNQLSVVLPVLVGAAVRDKAIWKFPGDVESRAVHISDITALYALVVTKIAEGLPLPSGEEGYYFAIAHRFRWHETLEALANALKARQILKDTDEIRTWPSNEVAAKTLETPAPFVPIFFFNARTDIVAERAFDLEWRPQWTEQRFLGSIDDEIAAVLELGKAKSSLLDS